MRTVAVDEALAMRRVAIDPQAITEAFDIVEDVRKGGEVAVREHAERLGDISQGDALFVESEELENALESIDPLDRGVLERTGERIRRFAVAQRNAVSDIEIDVPGGLAGHLIQPYQRAGCYAPGGRYPLPSSVLMTAIPAEVAGVNEIVVASPKPSAITLAAAKLSGVSRVLKVGGPQAIAALAFGFEQFEKCDIVVGPGNRWVTAAKQIVSQSVAIDMLAGPSEILIIADEHSNPELVASDLIAQTEHDPDAIVILASLSPRLSRTIGEFIDKQLSELPVSEIAKLSLENGLIVDFTGPDDAIHFANEIAPEHLSVFSPRIERERLRNYGALFLGEMTPVASGDYGIGPNHTLPTGGSARSHSGLSVLTFLRFGTWVEATDVDPEFFADAARLARLEGLEAHARSLDKRIL